MPTKAVPLFVAFPFEARSVASKLFYRYNMCQYEAHVGIPSTKETEKKAR
jgi:hypothetical protein